MAACDPVGMTEIAARSGIQVNTVREWRKQGQLPDPAGEVSGVPFWDWPTVEAWLANRRGGHAVAGWVREVCAKGLARAWRESEGLTLDAVAQKVGASPASLSLWERGLRTPTGKPGEAYAALLAGWAAVYVHGGGVPTDVAG